MQEIAARMERHFRFSGQEIFRLTMTAIVAAFGLTIYHGWGWFDIIEGSSIPGYFFNLLVAFCSVWSALLIHFSAQKIMALKLGYVAEYNYWMNGFIISTVLSFLTFGFIPLFFTGSAWLEVEKKIRMGRFRYGIMHKDIGFVSFSGPLASMLFAFILSPIYLLLKDVPFLSDLVFAVIVANLLVGLFALIPIPTFEQVRKIEGGTTGLYLFIASRWVFVLAITMMLIFSLLVFIANIFSLIVALLMGLTMAAIYYRTYESK